MAVSHRGAISFGMVHIPVGLYTATQDNDIHFNQLCKEDGSRVKYKKVCAGCGKEIGSGDIVKGFEYEKGKYYFDKRTKDWIKCKYLKDSDYVVCGYIPKENGMTSIVLGQYRGKQLIYKGNVTLGVSGENFRKIRKLSTRKYPKMEVPEDNEQTVWVQPQLVCTVKYMMKTESGSLRQPVFKGLQEDKRPEECKED